MKYNYILAVVAFFTAFKMHASELTVEFGDNSLKDAAAFFASDQQSLEQLSLFTKALKIVSIHIERDTNSVSINAVKSCTVTVTRNGVTITVTADTCSEALAEARKGFSEVQP